MNAQVQETNRMEGFEGRYREVTPPSRVVRTFEWDGMTGRSRLIIVRLAFRSVST